MTAYSLDLAPPEDTPTVDIIDAFGSFERVPTITSDGFFREKRVDLPEIGPTTDFQDSAAALDLEASSWFYYGAIPYSEGHPAVPEEFVWTLYKPGSDGSFQASRWQFNLRFVTDSPQVQLRLRAHNSAPKLGLIYVNGRRIQERSIETTVASGGYAVTLTFPDSREREIDIEGLNELWGSFGGVAINPGYSIRRPQLEGINQRRIGLIGDSFVDGSGGVSDVETFAWRLAVHLGATDIMSAGLGGTGWVIEANGDPNTRYTARIPYVMGQDPDVVLMAGGANESTATQQELVDQIKADIAEIGSGPQILLVNTAGDGSIPDLALQQVAEETDALYLSATKSDLATIDGTHLTYDSHQTWGDRLFASYEVESAEAATSTVRTSACTWPVSYDECGGQCEAMASLPASGQARIEEMATNFLWRWTGRKLGTCSLTIRPCRDDCVEGMSTYYGSGPFPGVGGTGPWRPVIIEGRWFNLGCGRCGDDCSCTYTPTVRLPGPVQSVESVVIDGEVLPASAYRIDNHKLLVRTDGGEWPSCQDLTEPSAAGTGADGTWEVTFTFGVPVPVGGQIAAGKLACELAKAVCGADGCELPQRVQSVTRQGVTMAILDSFEDVETGRTGIWLIDSWVASMMKPPARSRVYTPDRPRNRIRRQTWP